MACTLLGLPTEIRLNIYSHLFEEETVLLDAGNHAGPSVALPARTLPARSPESAEILRTCKSLRGEAQPLLYQKLTFRVTNNNFAGSLPYRLTDGLAIIDHVKHLIWELHCDFLKKFYFEDLAIPGEDVANLDSFEIRCRCENWHGSVGKTAVATEQFIQNRQQIEDYLRCLQAKAAETGARFVLSENETCLGKGEVRMKMFKQLGQGDCKVRFVLDRLDMTETNNISTRRHSSILIMRHDDEHEEAADRSMSMSSAHSCTNSTSAN